MALQSSWFEPGLEVVALATGNFVQGLH